jgi:hypothetical protein
MPKYIERQAERNRSIAEAAWCDYDEVIVLIREKKQFKSATNMRMNIWKFSVMIWTGGLSVSKFEGTDLATYDWRVESGCRCGNCNNFTF